jgi:hypothetical protein
VVRALTSKNIFFLFFIFYINFKLSDDFLKKKRKKLRPNGKNWSMENFEIFVREHGVHAGPKDYFVVVVVVVVVIRGSI